MAAPKTRKPKTQKNPTVKDVSTLAGVSTATVSRVLAGFAEVSDDVRVRVLEAVKALNYQPNRNARNLRMQTTTKIGVIVSDIQNPFFGSVLRGIEKVSLQADYTLILGNSDEDAQLEKRLLNMLLEEDVAGIIIAPTNADPGSYAALLAAATPIVVIDRRLPVENMDLVLVNGFAGAFSAVEHLAANGHARIGYVGGLRHLSVMNERERGYLAAIAQLGIPFNADYLRAGDNRQEGGYRAVCELLSLDPPPSAILIANNLMTLGGLRAIHESGLRIPEQVSLVGFDDMDWAPSLRPPLTVVAQPAFEMGETAATILLARIADRAAPYQTIMLDTRLVARASVQNLRPA